jgi:hypothetical protein
MKPEPFDAVVCVGPQHAQIAALTIRALLALAGPRKVLAVASDGTLAQLAQALHGLAGVEFVRESEVLAPINLSTIESHVARQIGNARRAGWYFQQFLKMGICQRQDLATHYLIWDADTVLLRPTTFFSETGQVLFNPTYDVRQSFFDTMSRLLDLPRLADHSFISEHLMISTQRMRSLIQTIGQRHPDHAHWTAAALAAIAPADLPGAGFSEFETYGNYSLATAPQTLMARPLRTMRGAARLFGLSPSKYALLALMRAGYDTASFEVWSQRSTARRATGRAWALGARLRELVRPADASARSADALVPHGRG